MPTLTLNRKTVDQLIKKKLSDKELNEKVPYLGISIEDLNKDQIHIEVEPNRPDLLSEQGFSRALSSFLEINTGLRKYSTKKSNEKVIVEKSVKDVRPYTACAIVKDLKFDNEKIKEIIQIQEKLHITYGRNRKKCAIGIYPFEKITPPIRFTAKDPEEIRFRPLESDKELTGTQILSKHPTGKEYGHLLEGKDKFPIFIDAKDQILSLPPIINSHEIGKISESTKEVFIECSGFDYNVLSRCLNMIVTALADMGGEIYEMQIQVEGKKLTSPDLSPEKMKVDIDYINKRLGLDLKEKDIKHLLEKMGFGYEKGKALIPSYRADILHQIDLAEDIAIAYGYDNFEELIPDVSTIGEESDIEIFKRKISEILTTLGFTECKTYHLTNKKQQTQMMDTDIEVIELANALTIDYSALAAWITPSLMHTLKINKHHEYPQNIFTIGTIFKKDKNQETGILEQDRISCLICNDTSDYTKIRQILDNLLTHLGFDQDDYNIQPTDHSSFIDGRVGRLKIKDKELAYIGELSPKVITNFELDMPVAGFELNLTELFEIIKN